MVGSTSSDAWMPSKGYGQHACQLSWTRKASSLTIPRKNEQIDDCYDLELACNTSNARRE